MDHSSHVDLLNIEVPSLRTSRARSTARAAGQVLFGSPGSRSPLVNWYLHEIGHLETLFLGVPMKSKSHIFLGSHI